MTIEAINPATGELVAKYDPMSGTTIARIVGDVHSAFLEWRRASFAERGRPMRNVAAILRDEAGALARLMAQEMGKPVRDGIAEVQKCASACDFFADNAARFLARESVATEARVDLPR